MNLLIQFPTFKRSNKFLYVFDKYLSMSSGLHSLEFNINCDENDATMNKVEIIDQIKLNASKYDHVKCSINFDKDTTKISAINDHINDKNFDIIICASDDMIPYEKNWDDTIASAMIEHFPNLNGCISFYDGIRKDGLITYSILGKKLYEYFGYIYHPDYKSLYCDDEFTSEVNRMNCVKYIDHLIVRHEHWSVAGNINSHDCDESAQKTLYYSGRDSLVFNKRKEMNFPKERITID